MSGNPGLLFLILWPVLGGIAGFFMGKKKLSYSEDVTDIVTLVELVIMAYFSYMVLFQGKVFQLSIPGLAGLGVSLTLDGFRTIYSFLTAFSWYLAACFSKEYLKGSAHTNRYRMFFLFTLGAIMGIFSSNNLYNLFMFFEIMSFVSFPLVIQTETKEAKEAGASYFVIAVIGGLLILMGMVLVFGQAGSLNYDKLHDMVEEYNGTTTLLWVGSLLMLLGFSAKASLFPLHTWLPKAHPAAPAPASAMLSGILTKTGVAGMIVVVCDIMFPSVSFGVLVLVLGTITMVLGGVIALTANEMKKTLAGSSMSQIGFITVGLSMCALLGEENALAVNGTLLHMINHTLFKLTLFFLSGVVVKRLGTGNLNDIKGFGKGKPLFHIAYAISAMGISGVPLLNGYVSKTLLHEALVEYGNGVVEGLFLLSGGLTFAYMLKLYIVLFWEKSDVPEKNAGKMAASTWLPCIVPAIACLVMGLLPNVVMDYIARLGRGFFHGAAMEHTVSYFSLENLKGAGISIGIGLILYFVVVRCFLRRKKGEEVIVYRAGFPAWLDLEKMLYGPLLFGVLPWIGTFVSRILDWFVDGIVLIMRRTLYRDNSTEEKPVYGGRFIDILGEGMNILKKGWNFTFGRRNPVETNYVVAFASYKKKIMLYSDILGKSVSFGLFMFALGFVLTIIYLICLM